VHDHLLVSIFDDRDNQAAAQFAEVSLESFGDHASSSSNNEFQKQF